MWEDRFDELKTYASIHGHCNVPKDCKDNRALAVWVKCQRRQYKQQQRGHKCAITPERIARLDGLGFDWCPSNSGNHGALGNMDASSLSSVATTTIETKTLW